MHHLQRTFSKRGFEVRSFGTGSHVKLPGPAPDKPNVYDFKTTYEQMYNDLVRKDKELYPLHSCIHTQTQHKHSPTSSCFFFPVSYSLYLHRKI
uniref:RNA polymerase II subunit A C-terminal domain phosphatase SSU72 n=1 Tax=Salmo salar TaxID=8030 RepID=B9EMB5_SALSA|nr:RNA polymerase II subunit A C-terminal domain phosphatase SSU72 [Salmo salar]